jgi:hypothetical protein
MPFSTSNIFRNQVANWGINSEKPPGDPVPAKPMSPTRALAGPLAQEARLLRPVGDALGVLRAMTLIEA